MVKRMLLVVLLGLASVTVVVMTTTCQLGLWRERPEPPLSVSPATTQEVKEPSPSPPLPVAAEVAELPLSAPSPVATEVTEPSPSPRGIGEQEPYIILYKNVLAGDYGVLRIVTSGHAEFTSYNRLNQITVRKRGDIGPEKVALLFQLLEEAGFFELENEYDIYPLAPDDTRVYEDLYYWVSVSDEGRPEKTVVAHEKARPPNLEEIIAVLLDILPQLPNSPMSGTFIIAGDYEILRHKRPAEGEPILRLDDESLGEYPTLKAALHNAFSLVQVEALEDTKLGGVLTDEVGSMEVMFRDKRFAVFLLKGQE